MTAIKALLSRRLTVLETVIVIAVLAALGTVSYLSCKAISAKILEAKINAATPKVCRPSATPG